ncbi:hypothetical protein B566_EDAN005849 [Ephemera danica]|nr:hypothetical protein B566_EDAN005849 [Ephemera danica]
MYSEGRLASMALQQFAEKGHGDGMDVHRQGAGGILDTFGADPIAKGNGRAQASIFLDGNHSQVSFVVRMIPSPDWFIGVDSINLCDERGNWIQEKKMELAPLDAGTDSGFTFTSPNWPNDPPQPVSVLTAHEPEHPAASFYYPELERLPPIALPSTQPPRVLTPEDLEEMSNQLHPSSDLHATRYSASINSLATESPTTNAPTPGLVFVHSSPLRERSRATTPRPRIRIHHTYTGRHIVIDNDPAMRNRYPDKSPRRSPPAGQDQNVRRNSQAGTRNVHPERVQMIPMAVRPAEEISDTPQVVQANRRRQMQRVKAMRRRKMLEERRKARQQLQEESKNHAENCHVSSWSTWSKCSATCGVGEETRTRTLYYKNNKKVHACPKSDIPLHEARFCSGYSSCSNRYFKW